jgi:hypothetical protein
MRATLAIPLFAALLASCAPARSAVPVSGPPAELRGLAGAWSGEYLLPEVDRSGSITFTLSLDGYEATGDVVMSPRASVVGPHIDGEAPHRIRTAPTAEHLTITFVRVSAGRVRGTIDSYRDPDCGCPVQALFTGEVRGDRVEGEVEVVGPPGHQTRTGRWWVVRNATD